MAYSDKVLDHYENPRNVGSFAKDEPNVGTGIVGAPECGDVMKLQLKISDDGVIEDAKLQDLRLRQRDRQLELRDRAGQGQDASTRRCAIKNTQIVEELSLPPVKIHCSVLAEDAIKAAIGDWKKRKARRRRADDEQEGGLRIRRGGDQSQRRGGREDPRPASRRRTSPTRPAREGRRRRLLGPAVQDGPRRRSATATRSSSTTAPR